MTWLRWAIALLIFCYGLLSYDRESLTWGIGGLLLFSVPLALQLTRHVLVRSYALWFGIFLVVQSLLSLRYSDNFVSLPPQLRLTTEVSATDIPGIQPGIRRVTTDAFGFRAIPTVNYQHKRGYRIFAIGGSTTEEIMLDDRATWPYLLQQQLSQTGRSVEVINTGVSGLRANNHLATLRRILSYQPDMVIFMMGGNDWNKQIKDHFEWRNHLPPSLRHTLFGSTVQHFLIHPVKKHWLPEHLQEKTKRIASMADYSHPRQSLFKPVRHSFRPASVSDNYRETLSKISHTCHQAGIACLFITQPSGYQQEASASFRESFWMTPPYAEYTLDFDSMIYIAALYNRFLVNFANESEHPVCDIAPQVGASYNYFYDDMHYNERGAQWITTLILPCVEAVMRETSQHAGQINKVGSE